MCRLPVWLFSVCIWFEFSAGENIKSDWHKGEYTSLTNKCVRPVLHCAVLNTEDGHMSCVAYNHVCRAVHGCSIQVRVTSFAASTAHTVAMAATDETQSWRPNASNNWSVIARSCIFHPCHLVRLCQVLNCQVRHFSVPGFACLVVEYCLLETMHYHLIVCNLIFIDLIFFYQGLITTYTQAYICTHRIKQFNENHWNII